MARRGRGRKRRFAGSKARSAVGALFLAVLILGGAPPSARMAAARAARLAEMLVPDGAGAGARAGGAREAPEPAGPAAAWDMNPLRRRSASVLPDFALGEGEERRWRCLRLHHVAEDAQGGGAGISVLGHPEAEQVSIPLRLTEQQEMTLSLLSIGERLGSSARGEARALHGTIYEVIINPAKNAFAYVSPRLAYLLLREIVVIILTSVR